LNNKESSRMKIGRLIMQMDAVARGAKLSRVKESPATVRSAVQQAKPEICSCCQAMDGERRLKVLGITDECPKCGRKLS
jgi:hypothetical protein